jgi:hypothetical protein
LPLSACGAPMRRRPRVRAGRGRATDRGAARDGDRAGDGAEGAGECEEEQDAPAVQIDQGSELTGSASALPVCHPTNCVMKLR